MEINYKLSQFEGTTQLMLNNAKASGGGWHSSTEASNVDELSRENETLQLCEPQGESENLSHEVAPLLTDITTMDHEEEDLPESEAIEETVQDRNSEAIKDVSETDSRHTRYRSTSKYFKKVRSRCLAKNKLFKDPEFPATDRILSSKDPVKWLRPGSIADDPQLFAKGCTRFDVQQGHLGDCWLVAVFASLTLNKKLFAQVVPDDQGFGDNYAGVFRFRFWQYGRWVEVVIDDRLPTYNGELLYLHSSQQNEFWGALLEKAYAKLNGSYTSLRSGFSSEAMVDLTGGYTEFYQKAELLPNIFTTLLNAYERTSLMTCSTDSKKSQQRTSEGLVSNHAYSITCVKSINIDGKALQLIRIRNPWGDDTEWNGLGSDNSVIWSLIPETTRKELEINVDDDGEFWMFFESFTTRFSRIAISHLSSEFLDPEIKKKWKVAMKNGHWIGKTAGGSRNHSSFWRNTQYLIRLTGSDTGDEGENRTIIVSLTQKNRRNKGLAYHAIGFAIYRLPENKRVFKHLNAALLKDATLVWRSKNFHRFKDISVRFEFKPGYYVIVPSTYQPGAEGEFLLRVFFEKLHIK